MGVGALATGAAMSPVVLQENNRPYVPVISPTEPIAEATPQPEVETDATEHYGRTLLWNADEELYEFANDDEVEQRRGTFVEKKVSLWAISVIPDTSSENAFISLPNYYRALPISHIGYEHPTTESTERTVTSTDTLLNTEVTHGISTFGASTTFYDVYGEPIMESVIEVKDENGDIHTGGIWTLLTDQYGNPLDQLGNPGIVYLPEPLTNGQKRDVIHTSTYNAGHGEPLADLSTETVISDTLVPFPARFIPYDGTVASSTDENTRLLRFYETQGDIYTHHQPHALAYESSYFPEEFDKDLHVAPVLGNFYDIDNSEWRVKVWNEQKTGANEGGPWYVLVNAKGDYVSADNTETDYPNYVLYPHVEILFPNGTPNPTNKPKTP